MNQIKLPNRHLLACMTCMALLALASAAKAQTISILGATPPVPGADDQYQTNMPAGANQPDGLNYYFDNGNAPSQTFTTGNNLSGYKLTSLAVYDAGNSGGSLGAQTFTLYIYSLSGDTASPLASYTSQSITIPDSQWFVWTNLGAALQPNTQYAWSMHRNSSGWANVGNVSGDLYPDPAGQVCSIPTGGGAITYSSTTGFDASFDVGLTPITLPIVGQTQFSPHSVVAPGDVITATAVVSGPGPLTYQWQTDGGGGGALTNIPGATSSNLVINTAGYAVGNYLYALAVTNGSGGSVGQVGVLTLQQPIGISGVIAVKFGFTNGYATSDGPFPADNTGVSLGQLVPPSYQPLTEVGNWINLMAGITNGADDATRTAAINIPWNITHDTAGNALSVTMTPSGFNDGWYSGGTECAAGRLLYDCWKFNGNNGQQTFNLHQYATLTFNNLPAAKYDVIVYVNNNNGNYWGNMQANDVVAQGGSDVDNTDHGFNGASADPCPLNPPLHTYAAYNGGNPANSCNYIKMNNVTAAGGSILITVVSFGGGDMGVSGVELVPSPDLTMTQDILPSYAETTVGNQVVYSAAFNDSPAINVQWLKISGGVTNTVSTGVSAATNNGVVTSTLTLSNVQLGDAATYLAKAVNAANSSDYALTSASQLVVSNAPAAVNNVVVYADARVGNGYYPPWAIDPNADLLFNFANDPSGSGIPGTFTAIGTFGADLTSSDPSLLVDGFLTDSIRDAVLCGGPGNGTNVTFFLNTNSAPLGYELTNIVVYGGWLDGGRRDQSYNVLYSTVTDPTNFVPLITETYLPADPSGAPIATRTRLVANAGVLAHNVYATRISWYDAPQLLNNYAFYSEIEIGGTNSTVIAPITPVLPALNPVKSVGGNLIVTGSGGTANGAYTWLSTTNLTPPVVWTTNATGNLDGTGSLSNSIPINPAQPESFFRLRMP
jgi:hypothetical protein